MSSNQRSIFLKDSQNGAISSLSSSLYTFGEFRVDPQNRLLHKGEKPIALTPKAFEVLLLLLQHSGEVVAKDELIQAVWPDSFVEDSNLTQTVFMLRKALGETSSQRYILTVQGRGYRFAPEVKTLSARDHGQGTISHPTIQGNAPAKTAVEPVALNQRIGMRAVLVCVALGLTVIATILWLYPSVSRRASASGPLRSIAVLPLENLSGDPAQDYFADAMTDELITNLAKVGSLRVTSRTTVALYKHTAKTLPEIARELNVDGIVEGSITRSGQRVRVTAQLIRAPADQHLWAESYERDFGDALQLQSDVARAITEQVRAQLTPELKAQLTESRPVNPDAYDSYLRGRYYIYNVSFTDRETLNRAKDAFADAIRRDPSFSPAYSGLAQTYVSIAIFGGAVSPPEAFNLARAAIRKAIQLDPNNGEAYDALGVVQWRADFDWKAADEAFSRGIALSPSYSCAHEDRAIFLALMGRRAESLAELEKSKQIDPGPVSAGTELGVFIQLRDWARLLESSRQQLAANENDWLMHANLGLGYEGTGKVLEAIAEYQRAVELSNGGDLNAVASLGHAYAVAGRRYDAEKVLHDLEQKSREGKASPYLPATIYAGLDEKDKALALIEKAYRDKSLDIGWILKPDLRTDRLRSEPRFQAVLKRTGLSQ
jgi:TolB-like protein/DNA-binding winged helix-turn-helix (wHTH) protein/Flp pilus assembly protein TadD